MSQTLEEKIKELIEDYEDQVKVNQGGSTRPGYTDDFNYGAASAFREVVKDLQDILKSTK